MPNLVDASRISDAIDTKSKVLKSHAAKTRVLEKVSKKQEKEKSRSNTDRRQAMYGGKIG